MKPVSVTSILIELALVTAGALAASAQSDWDDPFPPHRIVDHLYYVGSKGLATYLITTTNGHILINSSFERTVPIIRTNVEALGFKLTDIKILLTSHAHSDHASGHALVKKLTGARVEVMKGDAAVIANGGKGQYLYTDGIQVHPPPKESQDQPLRGPGRVSGLRGRSRPSLW